MSCPNSNSPIDINIKSIAGKCDLKCAYNFKYPNSSCVATNRGDYLSLTYDTMTIPPVTYNNVGYNVSEVRIYAPSVHSFNEQKTVAEIIIVHDSNRGTKPLLVCIPLINDNSNTNGSSLLTEIVNSMAKNAPVDGESTSIPMDNYTMNAFVPKKPFFAYSAAHPYQPCVGNVDIIVFGPRESKCYISDITLKILNKIISANTYTSKTGPLLFFNIKGPGIQGLESDIYIDCQPVDKSKENTKITSDKSSCSSTSNVDLDSIINSPLFQILMGSLVFVFIIFIFSAMIKALGRNEDTKFFSFSKEKT
jgi:carbonic anhydrase